jgi:hypothetical protein
MTSTVWEKSYDESGLPETSAKQSQFGPAPPCDQVEWCQTNPIRPGAGRQAAKFPEGETCETKPIRAWAAGAQGWHGCQCCRRGPIVPNKANSLAGPRRGGRGCPYAGRSAMRGLRLLGIAKMGTVAIMTRLPAAACGYVARMCGWIAGVRWDGLGTQKDTLKQVWAWHPAWGPRG